MRLLIYFLIFCLVSSTWGDIQFEEVSQQAGITRVGESWGNAWGDFDGDGYLDLWATNHRHKPSLYRNNGDGTFTNIIDEVWDANPLSDTHGVAWADYDNDGDQDLIMLSGANRGIGNLNPNLHNHFYVNENGILEERAAEFGINYPFLRGRTPLWFDLDRDGLLDLLMIGYAGMDRSGNEVPSALFRQTMTGFTDITSESGFHQEGAKFAQYADITGDGNMEILVCYGTFPLAVYDTLKMPFMNILSELQIPWTYFVQDTAIADFNGDLHPDFFLARGLYQSQARQVNLNKLEINIQNNSSNKSVSFKSEGDVFFRFFAEWWPHVSLINIGSDGHHLTMFEDGRYQSVTPVRRSAIYEVTLSPNDHRVIGTTSHPEKNRYGISVGYQPDTKLWTIIYQIPAATTSVEAKQPISELRTINFSFSDLRVQPTSQLLVNLGYRFQDAQTLTKSTPIENGVCIAAGDYDNDMDLDIYLVRSISTGNIPNHLYENRGDGTFIKHTDAGGANGSMQGQGQSVTMADYDRDGYLDLFVTNGKGAYPINVGPDQLFHNIGGENNWLQIDLEGTVSNRDGIGARIFATTPDGKTQLRENGGGIHWSQQDQKRIHFGLAQNEKVSELVIYWPSTIVQKLTDIPVNQVLTVVEEGIQTVINGDANSDGKVDIIDLLIIIAHFGEEPPSNARLDTYKDGKVDLEDVVYVINAIQEIQNNSSAPAQTQHNRIINSTRITDISSLPDHYIAHLHTFYEKIEELSDDVTQINLVKRFLRDLLMPDDGPLKTKLLANYPNPFNPETWIPYQLAGDTEVTIRVYNTAGETVRTLFSGHQESGFYISRDKAAYWDGNNEIGEAAASGLYFYELVTPTFKQTRKLVIIK